MHGCLNCWKCWGFVDLVLTSSKTTQITNTKFKFTFISHYSSWCSIRWLTESVGYQMMKSKYSIQVCWYVHSDQSSRSFRVGHIRSIHPLDKVVWFGYAFMARLLIYFLLRKLCIPYFSNVTREVSGEINFLLYTRCGSNSMSRKKRDLEPRLRLQKLICTIILINFFLFILFYCLLYVYLHKNYYSFRQK